MPIDILADPGEIVLAIECDIAGLDVVGRFLESHTEQFVITVGIDRFRFGGICIGLEFIVGWRRLLAILEDNGRDTTKLGPAMIEYCSALDAYRLAILGLSLSGAGSRIEAIGEAVTSNERMSRAEDALGLKAAVRARFDL